MYPGRSGLPQPCRSSTCQQFDHFRFMLRRRKETLTFKPDTQPLARWNLTVDMNPATRPKHSAMIRDTLPKLLERCGPTSTGHSPYSMPILDPNLSVPSSCFGNAKPDIPRKTLITGVRDASLMMPELIACCDNDRTMQISKNKK